MVFINSSRCYYYFPLYDAPTSSGRKIQSSDESERAKLQKEKKQQRAAIQTKQHKRKVIPSQKKKEVPPFLKNLVNKTV